ncbi:MAG TPA: ATP-binding protein [Mycobacteriales bacterium]|nr:ATP-binding protein [Mycobacteriales bacterium]
MAVIEVSFSALPAHVRTARLVALAVARRAGVPEDTLEEVRLAVGEACSRAVGLHVAHAPQAPVSMQILDGNHAFAVEVSDVGPLEDDDPEVMLAALDLDAVTSAIGTGDYLEGVPPGFGLAVIGGLVEDVEIRRDASRTCVRMTWPVDQNPVG